MVSVYKVQSLWVMVPGADPGFFVRRSRFSDVIRGGGEVLKIMLVIKYRLVREALVILDSLTNHVL